MVEKNAKFIENIRSEHKIMMKVNGTEGVIKCYGLKTVENHLNSNKVEEHLALEYCPYSSLHQICMFTKPFSEESAYIVMR